MATLPALNAQTRPRYQRMDVTLGSGAFGVVLKCNDLATHKFVAIKMTLNVFGAGDTDSIRRLIREVRLLRIMQHPYILSITDAFMQYDDLCIVSSIQTTDLSMIIKSIDLWKKMATPHRLTRIAHQMLSAVAYMHRLGILHRDIKPHNILIDTKTCDIKICDFGMSRVLPRKTSQKGAVGAVGCSCYDYLSMANGKDDLLTEYVVTRWYRAPEVMLSDGQYGRESDVWSLAATLFEIVFRRPLFPGVSSLDQLHIIIATIGQPTSHDMSFPMSASGRKCLQSMAVPSGCHIGIARLIERKCLNTIQPILGLAMYPLLFMEQFISLLNALLIFNPRHRVTCAEALRHSLFQNGITFGRLSNQSTPSKHDNYLQDDTSVHVSNHYPMDEDNLESAMLDFSDIESCPATTSALARLLNREIVAIQRKNDPNVATPSTGSTTTTVKTTPTKEGAGRIGVPSPQSIAALAASPIFDPSVPLTLHSHVHASDRENGLKHGQKGGSKTSTTGDMYPPPFPSLCTLPSRKSSDSINSMDVQVDLPPVDNPPTSLLTTQREISTKFPSSLSGVPFHHSMVSEPLYSDWFRDPSAPLKLNEFDEQVVRSMSPVCDDDDDDEDDNDLRDLAGQTHCVRRPEGAHQQHHQQQQHQQQQHQQQQEDSLLYTRPSFLSPLAEKTRGKNKINKAGTLCQPQDTINPHMSSKPSTITAIAPGGVGRGPGGVPRDLKSRQNHSFHPISSSSTSCSSSSCSSMEENMTCGSFEVMSPRRQGTAKRPHLPSLPPTSTTVPSNDCVSSNAQTHPGWTNQRPRHSPSPLLTRSSSTSSATPSVHDDLFFLQPESETDTHI